MNISSETMRRKIIADYWVRKLSGRLSKTTLFNFRQNRSQATGDKNILPGCRHENIRFQLPPSLNRQIEEKCRDSHTGTFILFLSGIMSLLNRYTGHEDIIIATSLFKEGKKTEEEREGFLFIRSHACQEKSFSQVFASVKKSVLEACNCQELSFPELFRVFEERGIPRPLPEDTSDIAFFYDKAQNNTKTEGFPLCIYLRKEEGFYIDVSYTPLFFREHEIKRFFSHLITLLSHALEDTKRKLSETEILSEEEKKHLIYGFNDTTEIFPAGRTVSGLFDEQARKTPDALAVVSSAARLSYRDLQQKTDHLARILIGKGVETDDIIGIMMEHSAEIIPVILAILKAGGAYLFIDPLNPPERISYMLKDSNISILITNRNIPGDIHFSGDTLHTDDTEQLPPDKTVTPVENRAKPSALSYVIYTSGTTGTPKGIMTEHHALCDFSLWAVREYSHREGFRVLLSSSFAFDASVLQLFPTLISGGTLYLMTPESRLDIPAYIRFLRDERINCIDEIPRLINLFFDSLNLSEKKEHFPELTTLSLGSEAVPIELVRKCRKYFNRKGMINNGYGPSEACPVSTTYVFDGTDPSEISLIGTPRSNMGVLILNTEGNLCPPGVEGEICIFGKGLARGYINNAALTAEKFIPNPFVQGERLYKTGDCGRWLENGNIEYLGRQDFQCKIRGYRVELEEVEKVLSSFPAVQDVVVTVRELQEENQQLIAYIIPREGEEPETAPLRSFLKSKLPEYMIPAHLVFIPSFPLTVGGKVDRKALPDPTDCTTHASRADVIQPRTPLEFQMIKLWEELLEKKPIGMKDNFFEIGGHSLLAVQLVAKIEKIFGKEIPLDALFKDGTVEQLTSLLQSKIEKTPFSPLVPLQRQGDKAPFFCVHPAGGNVLCFFEIGRAIGRNHPFYGLQAKGIDGRDEPLESIEEMASYYIDAILEAHPEGPYLLGGYSLGTHIAFEMAEQLVQRGKEVPLLAVFDTPGIESEQEKHLYSEKKKFLHIIEQIELHFEVSLGISANDLLHLEEEEQYDLIIQRMKEKEILPEEGNKKQLKALVSIFKVNSDALDSYTPPLYSGDITIFATENLRKRFPEDPSLKWKKRTTGRVKVINISGDHISFLKLPYVEEFAEKLQRCLDSCSEKTDHPRMVSNTLT